MDAGAVHESREDREVDDVAARADGAELAELGPARTAGERFVCGETHALRIGLGDAILKAAAASPRPVFAGRRRGSDSDPRPSGADEAKGVQMAIDTERGRAGLLDRRTGGGVVARLTTETKHAFKTTEFWAMVAVIAGILIASAVVDDAEGAAGDAFSAQRAWLYVAIVAVGYMVSRGLAKAGSREPYWAGPDDLPGRDSDDRG